MADHDRQELLDTIAEMDSELRQAARAGLLLLEKNADLEALVDYLATDLDTAQLHVRGLTRVVDHLRQQRRTAVLGDPHMQLTRIRELEQELHHDRAAWQSVEQSMLAQKLKPSRWS